MDEWHYQRGETTFGPISGVTLHSLVQRGRLQNDTRVRRSGAAEWSTVAQVLPDLPAVPDAAPSPSEQLTNAQPFDSSLPGASIVYAPPQSTLVALPPTGLPPVLWFGMIFCCGALLFEIAGWISMVFVHLSNLSNPGNWPPWLNMFAVALTDLLSVTTAVIATATRMLATVVWQACAFASLKHLYGDMIRRSRASGLWWFVPVANLFMPLLCLRDMRYFTRKRRDFPNSHPSFGPLLITMEALILIRFPITVFEALSSRSESESGYVIVMQLIRDFSIIAFSTTFLIIVISNFLQQRKLYAHWTDDAHWQNRSRP